MAHEYSNTSPFRAQSAWLSRQETGCDLAMDIKHFVYVHVALGHISAWCICNRNSSHLGKTILFF